MKVRRRSNLYTRTVRMNEDQFIELDEATLKNPRYQMLRKVKDATHAPNVSSVPAVRRQQYMKHKYETVRRCSLPDEAEYISVDCYMPDSFIYDYAIEDDLIIRTYPLFIHHLTKLCGRTRRSILKYIAQGLPHVEHNGVKRFNYYQVREWMFRNNAEVYKRIKKLSIYFNP